MIVAAGGGSVWDSRFEMKRKANYLVLSRDEIKCNKGLRT